MDKLLNTTNKIWDFPTLKAKDNSITKLDHMKIYEDSHGSGSLSNAKTFSYTTNNEDIWLLPSHSYLKVTCELKKKDGTAYEITKDGQGKITGGDDINFVNNGYAIFEEARYYLEDTEIERIDYVPVATNLNNLLTYSPTRATHAQYSELFWQATTDDLKNYQSRQSWIRKHNNTVTLLLPLDRIFPFFTENQHVFRGVKHRITFTLSKPEWIINKAPAVDDGIVTIKDMVWHIPFVEPSLETQALLETQLSVNSSFNLNWKAINVYKNQPPKNKDVRIALSSTIHKPKNVFIALQNLTSTTSQDKHSMEYDIGKLESVSIEVNGQKFPDRDMVCDKTTSDYHEMYEAFKNYSGNTILDYSKFYEHYSYINIDVSKHKPELYENTSFPSIVVNLKFSDTPTQDYIVWVIVFNEREAALNIENKKMRVIS